MPDLKATLITFPKISDKRGSLSFVEGGRHVPFDIKRVFYLYDIAEGEHRGAHAHKECHQFLVALNGSFSVLVDNGQKKETFHLDKPNSGLHIPPLLWATEFNFSQGAICLVFASLPYDESDYIRNYVDYISNI